MEAPWGALGSSFGDPEDSFSDKIWSKISEARSEGSIELKLVRKPPKVSKGECEGEELQFRIAFWRLMPY